MTGWQRAAAAAVGARGAPRWEARGGSAWGTSWRLADERRQWFVKAACGTHAGTIDAEADGLRALAASGAIRIPAIAATGAHEGSAFIVLEWLELRGGGGDGELGRALAALHRVAAPRGPRSERFGWQRDNWIGGTPQRNDWCDDWPAFFRDMRLAPQLELVARSGHAALAREGDRLLVAIPALLRGHDPPASLLHGDLWSGNAATLADGTPAVFDPAVYVGDRETDLAMTELFGGFGRDFHAAYVEEWPLPSGYPLRRNLYNLYHVLNHLNLFGGGYLERARRTIAALSAEAG